MSAASEATVMVFRFNPMIEKEPRYETYQIPPEAWKNRRVIDVIRYIYENLAPSLSFREPCGVRVCGSCTLMVNRKPVLACDALAEQEMLVEPLNRDRVIKDLAVEM